MADIDTSTIQTAINRIADLFNQLEVPLTNIINAAVGAYNFGQLGDPREAAFAAIQRGGQLTRLDPAVQPVLDFVRTNMNFFEPLSRMGIGNFDVLGMREKQVATGLTEPQFTEILTRHALLLTSAGTPAQTVDRAIEIQQKMKEQQLMKTGIEVSSDLNAAMLETAIGYASLGNSAELTKEQLDKLIAAATLSASQLQEQAMLSGRSREALSQETQARLAETRTRMAMLHMTEDQKLAYTKLIEMTRTLAPELQSLVLASARGARLTPDQQQTLASLNAMGPSGSMLMQSARAMMQPGASLEQRMQAERMMMESKGAIAESLASEQAYRIVDKVGGPLGERIESMIAGTPEIFGLEARRRAMGPGTTMAQAEEATLGQIRQTIEGKTATGEIDQRQIALRSTMKLIDSAQTQLAAVFGQFNEFTVQRIHLYAEGLQFLNETLFGGNKSMQEKFQQFGLLPGQISQGIQSVTGVAPLQLPPGNMPGPNEPIPSPSSGSNIQTFNEGTKEVKGKWFWPFAEEGELAILHGNEAVVPIDQLHDFISEISKTLYGSTTNPIPSLPSDLFKTGEETTSRLTTLLGSQIEKVVTGLAQIVPKVGEATTNEFRKAESKIKESMPKLANNIGFTPTGSYDPLRDVSRNWLIDPKLNTSTSGIRTLPGAYDGVRDFGINRPVAVEISDTARPSTSSIARPIRPGERINSNDAFAAMMFGGASRARTDEEDAKYKEWIMGGQVGPDPTRQITKVPKHISDLAVLAPKMGTAGPRKQDVGVRVLESRPKSDSEYALVQEAVRKQEEKDAASKALKTKKESAYQSEMALKYETAESGKPIKLTSKATEEMVAKIQKQQLGKIKTPESGRLPSMSDIASKMTEGAEPVKRGLDAAASVIPKVAEMGMPGSLGDMVGMLKTLNNTMTGMAATAKATQRLSGKIAKNTKETSGSFI